MLVTGPDRYLTYIVKRAKNLGIKGDLRSIYYVLIHIDPGIK